MVSCGLLLAEMASEAMKAYWARTILGGERGGEERILKGIPWAESSVCAKYLQLCLTLCDPMAHGL